MYPTLCQLYGKYQISSFSFTIAIGILTFIYLALRDKILTKIISKEDLINITVETSIAAIIGGRLLEVIIDHKNYSNIYEIVSIWNGGATVIGNITVGTLYAAWYLNKKKLPTILVMDRASIYAPVIHAFGRIGCFLVGCCWGAETNLPWAITYTNPEIIAPLYKLLHPTQLYSAIAFFSIFLFMRFIASKFFVKNGQLLLLYILLASIERFSIDFLRGDRVDIKYLSMHQWASVFIFTLTIVIYCSINFFKNHQLQKNESF